MFDKGADPNLLTEMELYRLGPLHIAVLNNKIDIFDTLLLSEKINIDLMSPTHGTPLHIACKNN